MDSPKKLRIKNYKAHEGVEIGKRDSSGTKQTNKQMNKWKINILVSMHTT